MIVSLDFWFAVAYAAVSLAFYFSRTAVSMALGYGVVVAGDFGTGRTLVARNVGFTHTGPLFIPHFYLTIASIFFFIDDCSKTEDKKFLVGRRICRFDFICGFQCRHDFWLLFSWQAWFISFCHWQARFSHGRPC